MKNCIIFCAAEFDTLVEPIEKEDCVLAADGGFAHLKKLGLEPTGVIGDFDSLGYVPGDARVYPVEKDDTDAMLAARLGLEQGCDRFVIYGGLDGPRLDHTLANFQTLQFLADRGGESYLVGRDYLVTVLKQGRLRFPAEATGILSVFCMGEDAKGVNLRNLQYPLENGTLTAGFPLGVSNHFIGKPAEISLESGSLLILWDRKNGFPSVERRNGNADL